jgi:hypothetical protein
MRNLLSRQRRKGAICVPRKLCGLYVDG